MPFKSKAQMKAAFSGALGPEMQSKAQAWAKETPNPKALPEHVVAQHPHANLGTYLRQAKKKAR